MFERLKVMTAEPVAMSGSLFSQIIHVAFRANRQILDESRREYTHTVPLTVPAIVTGVAIASVLTRLIELLGRGVWILVRPAAVARNVKHAH
jgi:ABC-type spermidine/putrescine transport system permease subunit II